MTPRGFTIWYADGTTYSDYDGTWENAPSTGVMVVVVYYDSPYRDIIAGGDWYYRNGDRSFAKVQTHPEWGKWSPRPSNIDGSLIKQGIATSDSQYQAIYDQAFGAIRA